MKPIDQLLAEAEAKLDTIYRDRVAECEGELEREGFSLAEIESVRELNLRAWRADRDRQLQELRAWLERGPGERLH
jgi:hypothetical protein